MIGFLERAGPTLPGPAAQLFPRNINVSSPRDLTDQTAVFVEVPQSRPATVSARARVEQRFHGFFREDLLRVEGDQSG